MEEEKELPENLSDDELFYEALAARIKLIKLQNSDGLEKEKKPLEKKDYIQMVITIVVCLLAVVAGAFWAA